MANFKRYKKYAKRTYKFGKKVYGARGDAKQALQLAKKVYRQINSEVHYHEISTNTTYDVNGSVASLHNISQGDTSTNRTGSSLKLARLSGNFLVTNHASATSDTRVRIIILRGHNEKGTAPTWANTYDSVDTLGQKLWNNRFNTKVLMDRVINIIPQFSGQIDSRQIRVNMKLYGHLQYEQGGNDAANGGLYLFIISNQVTNVPSVITRLRLTFYDN